MSDESTTHQLTCRNCGFEAAASSDEWGTADHPSLGSLTSCPDCGSTNTGRR